MSYFSSASDIYNSYVEMSDDGSEVLFNARTVCTNSMGIQAGNGNGVKIPPSVSSEIHDYYTTVLSTPEPLVGRRTIIPLPKMTNHNPYWYYLDDNGNEPTGDFGERSNNWMFNIDTKMATYQCQGKDTLQDNEHTDADDAHAYHGSSPGLSVDQYTREPPGPEYAVDALNFNNWKRTDCPIYQRCTWKNGVCRASIGWAPSGREGECRPHYTYGGKNDGPYSKRYNPKCNNVAKIQNEDYFSDDDDRVYYADFQKYDYCCASQDNAKQYIVNKDSLGIEKTQYLPLPETSNASHDNSQIGNTNCNFMNTDITWACLKLPINLVLPPGTIGSKVPITTFKRPTNGLDDGYDFYASANKTYWEYYAKTGRFLTSSSMYTKCGYSWKTPPNTQAEFIGLYIPGSWDTTFKVVERDNLGDAPLDTDDATIQQYMNIRVTGSYTPAEPYLHPMLFDPQNPQPSPLEYYSTYPGSCLRWPYGFVHRSELPPNTRDLFYPPNGITYSGSEAPTSTGKGVRIDIAFDDRSLIGYCEKVCAANDGTRDYVAREDDVDSDEDTYWDCTESKYVYGANDRKSYTERDTFCSQNLAKYILFGWSIGERELSSVCSESTKVCLVIPGSGTYGSVSSVVNAIGDGALDDYTILITPFNYTMISMYMTYRHKFYVGQETQHFFDDGGFRGQRDGPHADRDSISPDDQSYTGIVDDVDVYSILDSVDGKTVKEVQDAMTKLYKTILMSAPKCIAPAALSPVSHLYSDKTYPTGWSSFTQATTLPNSVPVSNRRNDTGQRAWAGTGSFNGRILPALGSDPDSPTMCVHVWDMTWPTDETQIRIGSNNVVVTSAVVGVPVVFYGSKLGDTSCARFKVGNMGFQLDGVVFYQSACTNIAPNKLIPVVFSGYSAVGTSIRYNVYGSDVGVAFNGYNSDVHSNIDYRLNVSQSEISVGGNYDYVAAFGMTDGQPLIACGGIVATDKGSGFTPIPGDSIKYSEFGGGGISYLSSVGVRSPMDLSMYGPPLVQSSSSRYQWTKSFPYVEPGHRTVSSEQDDIDTGFIFSNSYYTSNSSSVVPMKNTNVNYHRPTSNINRISAPTLSYGRSSADPSWLVVDVFSNDVCVIGVVPFSYYSGLDGNMGLENIDAEHVKSTIVYSILNWMLGLLNVSLIFVLAHLTFRPDAVYKHTADITIQRNPSLHPKKTASYEIYSNTDGTLYVKDPNSPSGEPIANRFAKGDMSLIDSTSNTY